MLDGCSRPDPSCVGPLAWSPRRTGWPRGRGWRCSSGVGTPLMRLWRAGGCCRWASRTRTGPGGGGRSWRGPGAGVVLVERVGTAVEGVVGAGLLLQVVEPHLNGPGGEVPILAAPAGAGRVLVVTGQGPVPAAATIGRFAELGLDLIPGTGLLPACVPGAFGAWMLLLRDHGTLGPRDVLEPAIGYAEAGFPAVPRIAAAIGAVASMFRDEWPSSAEVWLADGVPPPGGRL